MFALNCFGLSWLDQKSWLVKGNMAVEHAYWDPNFIFKMASITDSISKYTLLRISITLL